MEIRWIYYLLAGMLILVGAAGTVMPALPGLPLVFAGMLLASWAGDFKQVGGWMIGLLAILTVLSLAVDVIATALGAQRVGASRLALIGAVVGTFAGLLFGMVGVFVGPFLGALLGELFHGRGAVGQKLGQAAKVGFGTWLGMLLGTVLKLGLAFAMLGLFALAWFW
jgi:uncharacterized protein